MPLVMGSPWQGGYFGSLSFGFDHFGRIRDQPPTPAADVYVAKNGDDGNEGAEESPKLTIGGGLAALNGSETMIVKAGTYTQNNLGNNIPSGSAGNPTIIKANPGDTVILNTTSPESLNRIFHFTTAKSYVEIDGFDCDGRDGISFQSCKIENDSIHHIVFRNCLFHGNKSNAVLYNSAGAADRGNEFHNCDIYNNGRFGVVGTREEEHGFYISSNGSLFSHCRFFNNPGNGMQLFNSLSPGSVDDCIVEYCEFYGNGDNQYGSIRGRGLIVSGDNNLVYNCIFHSDNLEGGVGVRGTGNLIYNNTTADNGGGVAGSSGGLYLFTSGNTARNNIFYETSISPIAYNGFSLTESNNITVNPSFVNSGADDYHIQSGSAAENGGITLAEVTDDFDGVTRGSPPDVGAYEVV